MGLESAEVLERVVNGYIFRALLSREHLEEVAQGFGGMELPPWPMDKAGRAIVANAIGDKVLGPTWYYEVVEDGSPELPRVRVVITGRGGDL
jgi:hypothetical protein